MDLSICILTHNQPALLPKCVSACLNEITRANLSSEIVIIDNGSTDRYPQRLCTLSPMIRIIRNDENLGFAVANNKAIRTSHGRYVLILNDDAILSEGSLRAMAKELDSNPRVGAVGPRFLNLDGSLQRSFTNARFPRARHLVCQALMLDRFLERKPWTRDLLTVNKDPERSGETEHLAGACILARRDALDAVRLFDESFYYFAEDMDLCYRLKSAGWGVVYLAEVRVTHYGSASFKKLNSSETGAIYFRSLLLYLKKHSSPIRYFLTWLALKFALLVTMSGRAAVAVAKRRLA